MTSEGTWGGRNAGAGRRASGNDAAWPPGGRWTRVFDAAVGLDRWPSAIGITFAFQLADRDPPAMRTWFGESVL